MSQKYWNAASRAAPSSTPTIATVIGMPMIRRVSGIGASGLRQGIGEGTDIGFAGQRGARDGVDIGTVGGDHFLLEQRQRLAVDVTRGAAILRVVEHLH